MTQTQKTIIQYVLVGIIGVAIGFWGGVHHATNTRTASRGGFQSGTQMGQNAYGSRQGGGMQYGGRTGGGMMGGVLSGSVVSTDGKTLTIATQNGTSHIILISPTTTVGKSVPGSQSDIIAGAQVLVTGTSNSDGSLTAQSVQIRPDTAPKQ